MGGAGGGGGCRGVAKEGRGGGREFSSFFFLSEQRKGDYQGNSSSSSVRLNGRLQMANGPARVRCEACDSTCGRSYAAIVQMQELFSNI